MLWSAPPGPGLASTLKWRVRSVASLVRCSRAEPAVGLIHDRLTEVVQESRDTRKKEEEVEQNWQRRRRMIFGSGERARRVCLGPKRLSRRTGREHHLGGTVGPWSTKIP